MMPEAAVALATFVIVLLVLNRWMRKDAAVVVDDDEDVAVARRFIETKIDEHVEDLAKHYLDARGAEADVDEVPRGFAQEIEGFLAMVVMRDSADVNCLGAAIRRVVTLEREQIYALVLARIQAHLVEHHAA